MKQALFFILLLPVTLTAQNQDSINRLFIDSLKHEIEYVNNEQRKLELSAALGIHYNMAGKYDSARLYLNRALNLPGGREYNGGRLTTNLANSYAMEGKRIEALKYYMEAMKTSEQLIATDKNRIYGQYNVIRTMANLSEMYYMMGNQKQALYYAERGKELLDKWFDGDSMSYLIPQMLYVAGSVYLDRNELDKAELILQKMYESADAICRKYIQSSGTPNSMYMYVAYGKEGLARVWLTKKEYAKALEYAAGAMDYAERHGDPTVTAKILAAFSDIYLAQGNYEASGRYAMQAMELFPDYVKVNPEVAFNVATSHLFAGDREEAYNYYHLYAMRMQENTDKQFRETMTGMEIVYETEKKKLRIADLERQKVLYIFIGIAAGLLAIMIWIIFRQKIRNEQKEMQLAVANAVFEGEKRERERFTRDLHDGINGMLSAIRIELAATEHLQNIRDRIDDCIEEIRRLASGVMPVSLQRYGMKAALEDYCRSFPNVYFHFFGEDRRIDGKIELVVYYCAYELMHNSVRHSGATAINVQLIQEDDRISLAVQDNGCGYDGESFGQGVGLKSLHDRIKILNGKLEITSSPGNGTETTIELKI
jgi:signal transduction histidine kinase